MSKAQDIAHHTVPALEGRALHTIPTLEGEGELIVGEVVEKWGPLGTEMGQLCRG